MTLNFIGATYIINLPDKRVARVLEWLEYMIGSTCNIDFLTSTVIFGLGFELT